MSQRKETKVIHVDKLIINAKEVEIVHERNDDEHHHHHVPRRHRRDPWGFFWGRPHSEQDDSNESHEEKRED